MNLCFYGGSFDPPHIGHKKIVDYFLNRCDIFFIIPTFYSPFKKSKPTSFLNRKNMLSLMFDEKSIKKISVLDYEVSKKSIYTIDTIRYLKQTYPDSSINMIIGSDQLNNIKEWKNYESIIDNVKLSVISRPNINCKNEEYITEYVDEISLDISSSFIRQNINNLDIIKNMLNKKVFDYMIKNKLYI